MISLRDIDVTYVKGIGPARAKLLNKELGIRTAYDLVRHFPTHYVDKSKIYTIKQLNGDMPYVQLRGRFFHFSESGEGARRHLTGLFTDGTGSIEVVWFRRIKYMRDAYVPGKEYIIFGKPSYYDRTRTWSMIHPEIDAVDSQKLTIGLRGIYPMTERLRNAGNSSRIISGWIKNVLDKYPLLSETLPPSVIADLHLTDINSALKNIHNPQDNEGLQGARLRLKFEEIFYIAVDMTRRSLKRKTASEGMRFVHIGRFFNRFYNECLPFPLTEAQKRVVREIRQDCGSGRQMNRLVQGDVGSGKTIVALMAMLMALDNGAQACLMAPTEILASQHYESLRQMVAAIGVNVALLTGSTRAKARREILAGLLDGSVHIVVGTHALIEDTVVFKNLALAVIDEQHRFGVVQRSRLWTKNSTFTPHVLVMTATPIPRTLAMTLYGDLDVSVIDQLPPGRKPVTTVLRYDEQRLQVYKALGLQLRRGRQAYIVYPLIEENAKLDLRSLEEGYELIRETFPQYKVAFVHGRQKTQEKDYQMGLFISGKAQILVATTVIEVGVNVPNATTMIIENAERFGLSQLHQLRGRVGRGADQSYCVLMSKYKIATETRRRLELMTHTTDGFVIAEEDLKMRGPGDTEGTQQSGIAFDLHIANLARDGQIVQLARDRAEVLLRSDPELSAPENRSFARALQLTLNRVTDFSHIS